jgi:MscS family membrane protein
MLTPIEDDILRHLVYGLLEVAASAIFGLIVRAILNAIYRKIGNTGKRLGYRLLDVARRYIFPLTLIAGIYFGMLEFRNGLTEKNLIHLKVLEYLTIALFVALVITIAKLISLTTKESLEWYMQRLSDRVERNLSSTIVPVATKIANLLITIIAILIVLDHIGINIGGLVVSLGVGSLAVALAAQESISNMIGWFIIVMDQPFKIGDTIKLSTGEEGQVQRIGFRATRILNYDNNLIVVPNGDIAKSHITNQSLPVAVTRFLVEFYAAYGTDVDLARKIMLDLAAHADGVLNDPPPAVYVTGCGDSGIKLQLAGRTSLAKQFDVETSLREQIHKKFIENHVQFALPQRKIYTTGSDGSKGS